MAQDRLKIWEVLLQRALKLIDSVKASGTNFEPWSFGGGTVLMLRHRHRFSKDIDIFVPDPQYLNYVTPRLNDTAESMTGDYVEAANSLKLVFAEGEIDFIKPVLRDRSEIILARIADGDRQLRKDFAELEVLDYRPTYDECLATVKKALTG